MLKRQDSLLSSSSRRDHTPLPPEKRPLGCFAGVIHFLSKYQIGHRRKFLTFGKKKSESTVLQPSPKTELFEASPLVHPVNIRAGFNENELPTNKIRPFGNRSPNSSLSENNFPTAAVISSEETRRKLLNMLDKCDNDLKEIMQTVQFRMEKAHKLLPQEEDSSSDAVSMKHGTRFDIRENQYKLNRSAFNNSSNIYLKRHCTLGIMAGGGTHEQKPPQRKKPGESYTDVRILNKVAKGLLEERYKQRACSSLWSSKAMIKSVDEVCGDICWGEKREVRRLGLELQEFICGQLIQEFIRDFCSSEIYSLPYQKCKRRIQF